jgi:competence protein ComEC
LKSAARYLRTIGLLLFFIFVFTSCSPGEPIVTQPTHSKKNILVHYIDVGQADSILVQVNGKNLLIDAGNRDDGTKVVSYLRKHGVKSLDFVVATHPHEDHIGGMSTVLKDFPVQEFYAPKKTNTTKTFENMIAALNGKKIKTASAGIQIDLGENTSAQFIAPNSSNYEDINNYSASMKITYGDNKFLFMGDAEKLSEKEIIENNFNLDCDVLKVGHHGSSSSSSKELLDKATPKIAIISCGKGNDYGHPHTETLTELKKRNLTVYRTDIDGNIVLSGDGTTIRKQ